MTQYERRIQHVNTGNSGTEWIAKHSKTGYPVLTPDGERTIFRCGSREAESIEKRYNIYLCDPVLE